MTVNQTTCDPLLPSLQTPLRPLHTPAENLGLTGYLNMCEEAFEAVCSMSICPGRCHDAVTT